MKWITRSNVKDEEVAQMPRFTQKGIVILFASICLLVSGISACAQDMPGEYQDVLKFLDRTGDFKAGALKVNIPRNDLKMTIQGVSAPPPLGFRGWVAFSKTAGGDG